MSQLKIRRTITINAPINMVYKIVNNLKEWSSWSPWLIQEPEAFHQSNEKGDFNEWKGKRVGEGNNRILKSVENQYIDYELTFLKPWKSKANVRFDLVKRNGNTDVIWSMQSKWSIFLFWMKKMMMATISMDYDRGLNMLKEYVEEGKVHSKLDFEGKSNFEGFNYIGIKRKVNISNIDSAMETDFKKLETVFKNQKDFVPTYAFAQYHKWDIVKKKTIYTVGVGVKEVPGKLSSEFVTGSIPKTKVYKIRHTGKYSHLGNAWSTVMAMIRSKEIKEKKAIHPFELYINHPKTTKPKDLITDVMIPIK